jgi:DNA-binding MarR family transcriptional regulator
MKIEDEIKQTKPISEFTKTQVNFLYTSAYIEYKSKIFFKQYDLSPQQYNVLRILRGIHPKCANLAYITERMIDKQSNATRLIAKLATKKLVKYNQNRDDRRHIDICINDSGLELLKIIDDTIIVEVTNTFGMLETKELELLNSFLDRIRG